MVKLILIELKKICKKKSIFVMLIIMLVFNLLNNILFYTDYDHNGNYKYLETENIKEEIELLETKLNKYDYNKKEDKSVVLELKTKLELLKLKEKYNVNSWQYNKVNDYLYNVVESVNKYTYLVKEDNELLRYKNKLDDYLTKFDNDDWKFFIKLDIDNLKQEIIDIEEHLKIVSDKKEKNELLKVLTSKKKELEVLEYRLINNIKYDNSYLNIALTNVLEKNKLIKYYEESTKILSFREKYEYQELKEGLEENKYILKNKINYNKQNNLNYQLRTIVDDYEIFIIVIILIIASGIMADEFTSGTIKLLLIKPYSRGKILLSKYFAGIIVMFLVIIYLILLQLLIGSIIFGTSSLEVPVIIYDFNKNIIVEYNVFIYMVIRIITKLPLLLMLFTISFSISTIISSGVIAIVIPLFLYMFSPSIIYLIKHYEINILKYLINVNWDFNNYLFGRIYEIEKMNFLWSFIIWIIYFLVEVMITYFNFKRKNIRNV